MKLTAHQITIAVTVYDRRRFLRQAIRSALDQTIPVKVIVVEDCGPDLDLQNFVQQEFGSRVEYFRPSRRRGRFGNFNACLELCSTPWLSILHDDDYLAPEFIARMLALHDECPGASLYFGDTMMVEENGRAEWEWSCCAGGSTRRVTLSDVVWATPFAFPGHLMNLAHARAVGGFRETSQFCGDWELWCKLVAHQGGACSRGIVAFYRQHDDFRRGTNEVRRAGREYALNYVQVKRALHLLRGSPSSAELNPAGLSFQRRRTMSIRFLLGQGQHLSSRLLSYHCRLLLISAPPHWRYAVFKLIVCVGGASFVRAASKAYNWAWPIGNPGWTKKRDAL